MFLRTHVTNRPITTPAHVRDYNALFDYCTDLIIPIFIVSFYSNHLLFHVAFPSRFAAAAAFDRRRRPQPRRRSRRLQHGPQPGGAHRGRGLAAEDGRVGVSEAAAAAAAAAARAVAAAAVEGGFAVAGQGTIPYCKVVQIRKVFIPNCMLALPFTYLS